MSSGLIYEDFGVHKNPETLLATNMIQTYRSKIVVVLKLHKYASHYAAFKQITI